MASTYSDLKIELIGTGEQTGTWGTTTNNNFSVAIGEAITGSADVAFSSADVTVTLTDTNAAQTARNLRLNLTGTSGGARQLILGSGCQIEKLYLINNGLADAVTVKNTSGTGIAVPAGKTMFVFNNGTNVVDVTTHLTSLTLGTALPVASGGTGLATLTANNVLIGNGTSNVGFVAPGSNGNVLTSNGTTWTSTTPAAGTTFSAGTTGFTPNTATSGAVTLAGTLGVANGGTGLATLTANNVLIGNGTSNVGFVAPGSNGNILTSNGTTWTSAAPSGGVTSLNGQTGAITNTTLGAIGSYLMVVNNTTSNFGTNATTAGSDLRYPSQISNWNGPNQFQTVGSGGSIPRSIADPMGSSFTQYVSGNQGNSGNAIGTTALSGTWQAVTPASGRGNNGFCGCNNSTDQFFGYTLWVRIS